MTETQIGVVTHFFDKILVAAISVTGDALAVGDTIHVKGHTSDFTQTIDSMQVVLDSAHVPAEEVPPQWFLNDVSYRRSFRRATSVFPRRCAWFSNSTAWISPCRWWCGGAWPGC